MPSVEPWLRSLLEGLQRETSADVVYLSRFTAGSQHLRLVAGRHPSIRLFEGEIIPLESTYCWRVPQGAIEQIIVDRTANPTLAALSEGADRGIGGYVAMPLHAPDGQLYGTLCVVTHEHLASDGEAMLHKLGIVADLIQPALPQLEAEHAGTAFVGAALRRFLAGRGLTTVFQPIVELSAGRTVALEALSRFESAPQHGPDWWLYVAHGMQVGLELELVMLRHALAAATRAAFPVPVSVNVSPLALQSGEALRILRDCEMRSLDIELTEHAIVHDYERLRSAMKALAERGYRIVVDDAGAGFASFRHVVELRPSAIKLDMSLVRAIDTDLTRQTLATALREFGTRTAIAVVAEGVETRAEASKLRELEFEYAQGNLFAPPLPADDVKLDGVIFMLDGRHYSASSARNRIPLTPSDLRRITDSSGIPLSRSSHAVLLADDAGRYVGATPAALALLGYSLEELCSKTVAELTVPEHRDLYKDLWRRFERTGTTSGFYAVRTASGKVLPLRYRARRNVIPGIHLSHIEPLESQ